MVIGNEFVVCRENGKQLPERDKAVTYIRDHLSEFDVSKLHNAHYPKITTIFDNMWDSIFSFNLHQDIDIWMRLGKFLVIDGNFDTYVCVNTNKATEDCRHGALVYLYIKFTKSLITELCDISGMTKEQACALIQVFAMVGSRDSSFDKMCLDFTNNGSDSVISKLISPFTEDKNTCDEIYDCICGYLAKTATIRNVINLFITPEIAYCRQHDLDAKDFLCSGIGLFHETSLKEIRDDPSYWVGSSLLTLEEVDDIIYTDNPQKVFEQKGLVKYISDATITWKHGSVQNYVTTYDIYDAYNFEIVPSNIAGLSHFGGKLVRIL